MQSRLTPLLLYGFGSRDSALYAESRGAVWKREVRARAQGDSREQNSLQELKARPSLEEIIAAFESVGGKRWLKSVHQQGDWSRDLVLYLAHLHSGLSLKELGQGAGGMDYGAVSEAIRRFRKRVITDQSIADIVERTCRSLKI